MVMSKTMLTRMAVRRIAQALHEFAQEQGWKPAEYQIFFRIREEWGRITMIFIIKGYNGMSEREMWGRIHDRLERSLIAGTDIGFSFGLSVRSQEQVDQGGMYAVPDGYLEEEIVLCSGAGH